MSHLDEFKTSFKDKEAFIRGLVRTMNLACNQIEVYEKAQPIVGYHKMEDRKFGHVIVRREHTRIPSDIGWEMKDGVLVSHLDAFQYHNSPCYDQKFILKLTENYNFELSKMAFESKGIKCTECRDAKGRLQLRAKFAKAASRLKIHI